MACHADSVTMCGSQKVNSSAAAPINVANESASAASRQPSVARNTSDPIHRSPSSTRSPTSSDHAVSHSPAATATARTRPNVAALSASAATAMNVTSNAKPLAPL